jgi:hypothetical protein
MLFSQDWGLTVIFCCFCFLLGSRLLTVALPPMWDGIFPEFAPLLLDLDLRSIRHLGFGDGYRPFGSAPLDLSYPPLTRKPWSKEMAREFQNARLLHMEHHSCPEAGNCEDIPTRRRELLLLGYLVRLGPVPSGNGCFDIAWAYDALIYARALGNRSPGTHSLHLVEGADHNFTKRQDDVVNAILQWWDARQRGELPGVEPKNAKL